MGLFGNNDSDDQEDTAWEDLPPDERWNWQKLGWNEDLWNDGEEPETSELDWDELTGEQQRAATALGYTQAKWDADD